MEGEAPVVIGPVGQSYSDSMDADSSRGLRKMAS